MAPPPSETAFLQTLPSIPRDAPPSRLFRRLDKVGQGAYGSVYKAIHEPTGFVLALKVIDLDTQDDDTAEIQHEVGMLSSMTKNGDADRNNVTRYFGCWMEGPKVWIAMDYADGGSLRTLVSSPTLSNSGQLGSRARTFAARRRRRIQADMSLCVVWTFSARPAL